MNIKKIAAVTALACASIASVFAKQDESKDPPSSVLPPKIAILICDVGTIDQVAKTENYLQRIKQFNTQEMPKVPPEFAAVSESAVISNLSRTQNEKWAAYREAVRAVQERNRRMEKVYEGLRNQTLGEGPNRILVTAKTQLQAAFFEKGLDEYFSIIDRANTDIAEVEKAIGGNDQQDVASATIFLTVIAKDQKEETMTVQVGNTMVTKIKTTRVFACSVRDFNGNVVYAFEVTANATRRKTSVSQVSGYDPSEQLLKDALSKIADKIKERFTAELKVKVRGPKNDEDFEADDATIYVNDEEFDNGSRVFADRVIVVRAEMDGYKDVVKVVTIKKGKKSQSVPVRFKAANKAADKAADKAAADDADDEDEE